ncbi:MAG: hypothetical protein LBC74_07765 [Planctomycetaceae bacterium]|nr:hypothetical protein [Planctomycetaceae bacterium]
MEHFYKKIQQFAEKKKIPEIQTCLSEIDIILKAEPNSVIICSCWSRVLGCLGSLNPNDIIQTGIEKYLWNVTKLNIDSIDSKLIQIDLLETLLRPKRGLRSSDKKMNSKRLERVVRLIELVMEMYERYEPDWNPDDPKNHPVSESKIYNVISNERPNPVTEPDEAAKYERFCRRVAEYWQKRHDQEILAIFPKFFDIVNKTIIDSYLMEPRNDNGLIQLLEKSKYPFVEQIKILCDLKISYKGFRNWESADKLFKAAARFISLEKDEVNLEKADGKKTSIELSVLRKEDQDYVKEQLESEKKTGDDEKLKKD